MNAILLRASEEVLRAASRYYESGEYVKPFRSKELADCVVKHAAAVGVASFAACVLPLAGAVAAGAVVVGAVWRMYVQICKLIGVPFGKNKLKAIASAVLTNVVTEIAGIVAIGLAVSWIPGAASVINGTVNFASTYLAGLIFLMVLTKLFNTQRLDVEEASESEIAEFIKGAFASIDVKAVFAESKELFNAMRKDGSLGEMGKDVDISDDEP